MLSQRKIIAIGFGTPILLLVLALSFGISRDKEHSSSPGVQNTLKIMDLPFESAPNFEITTLDGKVITLNNFKGKILMIDFWSSWCGPCKSEGAMLGEAYRDWKDSGVEFIGIAVWDQQNSVKDFIIRNKIEYVNAIDDGSTAVEWGVRRVPEKFFISGDGRIYKKIVGPNTKKSLDKILKELTDNALGIPHNSTIN